MSPRRRFKSSSQVLEEIIDETYEEYRDEVDSREQVRELIMIMHKEFGGLFPEDEFPIVNIPKLGTFFPIPGRVEDMLIKEKDNLDFAKTEEDYIRRVKKINKLEKEHARVKYVANNYNKKNN